MMTTWGIATLLAALVALVIWIVALQLASKDSGPCEHVWRSVQDRVSCIHCGYSEQIKGSVK